MLRLCFACLAVVCALRVAHADPLAATVVDGTTMQPIAGATITIGARTLAADDAGHFAIDATGPVTIAVSANGYDTTTQTLGPDVDMIVLLPHDAAEVVEVRDRAPARSATDSTEITMDVIRALPGGGEDALAAVRSLPGVGQAPPTAGGRLVVRGSAPEDTRLTIDGISVPFLYHAFNNTTIVPPAGVASIEYTASGFGAEEGRATGGLVALTTDDTQPVRPTAEASLSLLEVAAHAAAPVWQAQHVSVAASLRRSTVDFLAPLAVPKDAKVGFVTAPRFYDGQLRVDWRPSGSDRVALLGLLSSDRLAVVNNDPESDLPSAFATDTKFARLIATWKHKADNFDNRLVGSLGASWWNAAIGIDQNVDGDNRSFVLRDDLRVIAGKHVQLRGGGIAELADTRLHALSILPPTEGLPPGRIDDLPIKMIDARYDANYAGAYAAVDVLPTRSTTLTAGTRVEVFGHLTDAVRVLPRLSARQRLGPVALTASLGRYARDLDQAEGIPRDLAPELATQATLGTEIALADGVGASLTGFYADHQDLVVEDPTKTAPDELPYKSGGTGTSQGVEALIRAHRGNFFGWIAYTLSKSTRRDAPGEPERPFAYDQRHLVSVVASWTHGAWQIGGRWQLATGLPYTEITGAVYSDQLQHWVPTFGPPLGARFATSHQLDLRVERSWKRDGYLIAVFTDLSNVYRNDRVLRYQYSADFMTRKPVSDLIPLPSLGVRGEF